MNKYRQYIQRNGENIFSAILKRHCAVLYSYSLVRKILHPFKSVREPDQWIFVLGCYNSGTTILKDIIGCHPAISTLLREGAKFTNHLPRPEDTGWERMWIACKTEMAMPMDDEQLSKKIAVAIKKDWSLWWGKKTKGYLEKSVSNTTRILWFERYFKNPTFIAITRDPIPVVEGIRRKAQPRGQALHKLGSSEYPLNFAIDQWNEANTLIVEGEQACQKYLRIRYEDFASNPTETLTEIWNHLGLEDVPMKYADGKLSISNRVIEIKNMNSMSEDRLSQEEVSQILTDTREVAKSIGYHRGG